MEDMNAQAQLSAAQQLAASGAGSATTVEDSRAGKGEDIDDDVPELETPEDDGPIDETGVDPKDIELVMKQVSCSRAKAVRVLKESGGDLINASAYMLFRVCDTPLIDLFPHQLWQRASDFVCIARIALL
jgi:nascent polypeptide-associated complex subunit alpha